MTQPELNPAIRDMTELLYRQMQDPSHSEKVDQALGFIGQPRNATKHQVADQFEQWMEIETSYALTKFPPFAQYRYLEQGVSVGVPSFKSSAINYMRRAAMFADARLEMTEPRIGLQLVQSLGKAAHNLFALKATAASYETGKTQYIAQAMDAFSATAGRLGVGVAIDTSAIAASELGRHLTFDQLQVLQDVDGVSNFHKVIDTELNWASSQFVTAAVEYGWPEPGRSSGDVEPWSYRSA